VKNNAAPRQVLTRVPTDRLRALANSDDRCATRVGFVEIYATGGGAAFF
jgi:hypothetical protein